MISILDYGIGNLGSIANMLRYIGVMHEIIHTPEEIQKASKILLPGVGAFDLAMNTLRQKDLIEPLNSKALKERVPILGICLGMQLLTNGSEEGTGQGLGWVAARTVKFKPDQGLKIPHMGWNVVVPSNPSPLTQQFPEESRFYFVHSYCVHVENPAHSILRCKYGEWFDAAIQNDNVFGAQFHPEKSHKFGMQLLKNFAAL